MIAPEALDIQRIMNARLTCQVEVLERIYRTWVDPRDQIDATQGEVPPVAPRR